MKDRYLIIHKGIARWKLNNLFENWLSYKADYSELWKRIYVLYYKIFDYKYYKGGLKYINNQLEIHKEKWEGIPRNFVIRDMVYSLHRFGADFQDYWSFEFLLKSSIEKSRWVTDKLRYGYDDLLSSHDVIALVEDKYKCYCEFIDFYKRDALGCYGKDDYAAFKQFTEKHPQFIYKPLNAFSGRGIQKVDLINDSNQNFFDENIKKGPFIIEEIIKQNEKISYIHPQSINTIRVVTFAFNNRIEILATSLRMGVGNSIADNAGNGGIFTSVDTETGIIVCPASNYKGDKILKHPDTNITIPGIQIPNWDELISITKEVALKFKKKYNNATLISWDFSYSIKGWVIVEVNTGGGWRILQAAQKEPLKKQLYKLIDELVNNK